MEVHTTYVHKMLLIKVANNDNCTQCGNQDWVNRAQRGTCDYKGMQFTSYIVMQTLKTTEHLKQQRELGL